MAASLFTSTLYSSFIYAIVSGFAGILKYFHLIFEQRPHELRLLDPPNLAVKEGGSNSASLFLIVHKPRQHYCCRIKSTFVCQFPKECALLIGSLLRTIHLATFVHSVHQPQLTPKTTTSPVCLFFT
ncbi:hypothetical protein M501DRAFT_477447 [Patellaria atrata CBS 101060]|uniref:Uncharacterized protein n=1 Tax=Patellaria atrata CBS 101060 TaxID=1346257 RepID=A0A9P4S4J7_9PEZI|nr:hypothetical protein M501DRAFT_477447 [Patellaria atrata CBS 101060]